MRSGESNDVSAVGRAEELLEALMGQLRSLREKGEDAALDVVAQMRQGLVVDLDGDLALEAARLGLEFKLPLADSVILATARSHAAIVWTQDEDFDGVEGVRYFPKKGARR